MSISVSIPYRVHVMTEVLAGELKPHAEKKFQFLIGFM